MKQEKLEQIKQMIPMMKDMVDEDLAIAVWDLEGKVLHFSKANTFPLHFDVGYEFPDKQDKIFQVMATGKTMHNKLPKELFGVAVEGNIIPVFDGREVVGCITSVYSVEKMEVLQNTVNEMQEVLSESKQSISDILNAAINTSGYLNEIHEFIDNLQNSLKGVYDVVGSIKKNTSHTKMLALNASIEAARAGNSGVGFKIVANEMGKLSELSAESVVKINETLGEMEVSIGNVTNVVNQIYTASFKNSEVVEKILKDLDKI